MRIRVVGVSVPGGTSHPPGIYLHGYQVAGALRRLGHTEAANAAVQLVEALERDESTPIVEWPQ